MLDRHMELMWAGALGAIPIAVIVGVVCRLFVRRPATRHAMWVMVLASSAEMARETAPLLV